MLMKLFIAFFLFINTGLLFSQEKSDTLNQVNAKGKKHGFWVEYLNDKLINEKNSSTAYYYAYNYYENGKLIVWTSAAQYYKKKALYVISDSQKPTMGKPVLLNGNFKFYYKDSLGLDETYKDGLPVYTATCALSPDGIPVKTEILDYTKQYKGQFGSFLLEIYKTDGKLVSIEYFCKNAKGKWTTIKAE